MAVTILLALAPIFFILAVGYGAGRLHVVDNRNVDSLNVLVMTFALPAALFVATASAPRSELLEQVPLFVILSLVMLAVHLGWYALARRFWQASKADAALQALSGRVADRIRVAWPVRKRSRSPWHWRRARSSSAP